MGGALRIAALTAISIGVSGCFQGMGPLAALNLLALPLPLPNQATAQNSDTNANGSTSYVTNTTYVTNNYYSSGSSSGADGGAVRASRPARSSHSSHHHWR